MLDLDLNLFKNVLFTLGLAQFSVSVERPCPMETVTFTCTVTGNRMNWETSDVTLITLRNSSDLNVPEMPEAGYTVTQTRGVRHGQNLVH